MELLELGGESPRVTAPTLSPQATAALCTPRPPAAGGGGGRRADGRSDGAVGGGES